MDEFWAGVERRHGLLTTAEGIAHFGRRGFYRRVAAGQFIAVHTGVWRVAGAKQTERQQLLGLAIAFDGVASSKTTFALVGIYGYTFARFHLTHTRKGARTRELPDGLDVSVHRSTFLPEHHITEIDAIPTMTVARALCDISAHVSIDRLSKLVDTCKRLELVDYDELAKCREELRARGRRRTTYLDVILEDRAGGWVVGDSPPEDRVRKWLEGDGFEPAAQHWTVANGRRRQIDIALIDDRVAIEYQGLKEHATPTAVVNDSEKVTDLQLAGWFVVLVTKKTTRAEFLKNVREGVRIQRERRP